MVVVTVQKAVASNVDGRPETGSRVSRLAGPFVKCVCVSIIELITDFELLELSMLKLVCNILTSLMVYSSRDVNAWCVLMII